MGKRIARRKLVLRHLRKPAKPGGNGARNKRGRALRITFVDGSKHLEGD
jgi:hypothetical protein